MLRLEFQKFRILEILNFHPYCLNWFVCPSITTGLPARYSSVPIKHQGSHRIEKYFNLEGVLEKSKIKSALKITQKALKTP